MSFVTAYVEKYQDDYERRRGATLVVFEGGRPTIHQGHWWHDLILGSEFQCLPIGYTVAKALVFSGEAGLAWDPLDVCIGCKSGNYRRRTVIQRFEATRTYLIDNPCVMRRPYLWDDDLEADKMMPYVKDMMERTIPETSELPAKTRHYVITERAVAMMEIDIVLAGLRASDVDIATMAWVPPWHCPGCMPECNP
jgi:hypothetical protein